MKDLEYGKTGNAAQRVTTSTPVGTEDMRLNAAEVLAGLQAGLVAGVVMGILIFFVSLGYGFGLWTPFNDVAGIFFPMFAHADGSFQPLAVPIAIVIHLTTSVLLGMAFAAIYSSFIKLTFSYGLHIMVGVLFGMLIWLFVRFIGVPLTGSQVYQAPAFLMAHALFGALLAILYPLMPARRS